MSDALRVLYLAPRGTHRDQLSRYTFIDEEIRGLAEAGVEAFVLGRTGGEDRDLGRIHIRAVPPDTPLRRSRVGSFVLRHTRQVPWRNFADVRQIYRAARIECRAAEIIRSEKIDLIHSHFGYPRGFGGLLARSATASRLVAHLRGNDINADRTFPYGSRLDPSFDRAIRLLLQKADTTVFVSDFLRRQAAGLGARPEIGRVILQGVKIDIFARSADKAQIRGHLGLGCGAVILAVAGLIPVKGVDQVLESLARLRGLHEFSLVVCGEGPQRAALEAAAHRLGLGSQTRFVGRVARSDVAHYFAAADLFVHGSRIESAGYVLIEAMAAGLPVVCTDAGGPAEYVKHDVAGFVVPVADPAAMAEKVLLLLQNVELRERFARQARKHAETHFTYERMIQQTLATYRAVA
jgi:glycosyltransferase involved in cell wall biosynthesis